MAPGAASWLSTIAAMAAAKSFTGLEIMRFRLMAADARNLLDHLGIRAADIMGYSLGARIATAFALAYPERAKAFIFGGLGGKLLETAGLGEVIARALEAPSLADVEEGLGKTFRAFSPKRQKAICGRSPPAPAAPGVNSPRRTLPRSSDAGAGRGRHQGRCGRRPAAARAHLAGWDESLAIPDRDHNRSVGDAMFKKAALDFLERWA